MKRNKRSRRSINIQRTRQAGKSRSQSKYNPSELQKLIREDKKSDYQINWQNFIAELEERSIVKWQKVSFLSVMGDAPKDFITDREERIALRTRKVPFDRYIAKVGSKFYPIESIVEQFLTRIGQSYGLEIADSKLRIVAGQVRFMSKYFLRKGEQLTHGAEILALSIGKAEYKQIEEQRTENEYFSFQMVCEAIEAAFPNEHTEIIGGLIAMLAFDALIGHNDRHPYNWGVIVPLRKDQKPRFSPVYDTARALFWNVPESRVKQMLTDQNQLDKYVRKCEFPFCWDAEVKIDFFRLIGLIWNGYERYRNKIETFLPLAPLENSIKVLDTEFSRLMSAQRRELIKRCLYLRHKLLNEAVDSFRKNKGGENDGKVN